MARFRLLASHSFGHKSYKAGTVICDGTGAQAGDVIVSNFTANNVSNAMVALDAGATTLKNASRFPQGPTIAYPDGANSIDA